MLKNHTAVAFAGSKK